MNADAPAPSPGRTERSADPRADDGARVERSWLWANVSLLVVLTSIFLGTLVVITPVTRAMSAEPYVRVQQPMVRHVTPIASGVGVLAGIAAGGLSFVLRRRGRSYRLSAVAFLCVLAIGISSSVVNVPINADIQRWSATSPPSDWATVRDRWDLFHLVRTALSLGALLCVLRLWARPSASPVRS